MWTYALVRVEAQQLELQQYLGVDINRFFSFSWQLPTGISMRSSFHKPNLSRSLSISIWDSVVHRQPFMRSPCSASEKKHSYPTQMQRMSYHLPHAKCASCSGVHYLGIEHLTDVDGNMTMTLTKEVALTCASDEERWCKSQQRRWVGQRIPPKSQENNLFGNHLHVGRRRNVTSLGASPSNHLLLSAAGFDYYLYL